MSDLVNDMFSRIFRDAILYGAKAAKIVCEIDECDRAKSRSRYNWTHCFEER
jgi:hypothetical protein